VTEALKHGLRPEDRERALEQWTRQIEQEDQSQQPVYEALIMRSDPQSID